MTTLEIGSTWDGEPIPVRERVQLSLELAPAEADERFTLRIDAPDHGDPPPPGRPRSLDGLWEYEVVELFLLGDDEHYLEIEVSPHGHYLALQLHHSRQLVAKGDPLDCRCERSGGRWQGVVRGSADLLPAGLHAANAYAIHGVGAARRYLAAHPVGGAEPDFHRLASFRPLRWRDRD